MARASGSRFRTARLQGPQDRRDRRRQRRQLRRARQHCGYPLEQRRLGRRIAGGHGTPVRGPDRLAARRPSCSRRRTSCGLGDAACVEASDRTLGRSGSAAAIDRRRLGRPVGGLGLEEHRRLRQRSPADAARQSALGRHRDGAAASLRRTRLGVESRSSRGSGRAIRGDARPGAGPARRRDARPPAPVRRTPAHKVGTGARCRHGSGAASGGARQLDGGATRAARHGRLIGAAGSARARSSPPPGRSRARARARHRNPCRMLSAPHRERVRPRPASPSPESMSFRAAHRTAKKRRANGVVRSIA